MSPLTSAIAATTCSRSSPGALRRRAQEVDGEGAGDLAGAVAAHPVGDDEHVRLGEEVVLVVGPDAARVGGRAPAQLGHYCASSTV